MPDDPQVAMSHATAMARIATMLNPSGTDLSSTTGATKTAPNRPISSTSYQSAQRSDQGGSTGFGQPLTPMTPLEGPPEGQSSERSLQGHTSCFMARFFKESSQTLILLLAGGFFQESFDFLI